MNSATSALLAMVSGIITLAIVSVLVSKRAQTPSVIGAAGSALGLVIGQAVSPVTGASTGTGAASGGLSGILASGNFSPLNATGLFGGQMT